MDRMLRDIRIVALKHEGLNAKTIALRLKITIDAVYRAFKREEAICKICKRIRSLSLETSANI